MEAALPDDGSGVYTLPPSYRVENGDTTDVSQHNPPFEDVAQAISNRVHRDGRTSWTGNHNANGNKLVGLATGTNANDAVRVGQLSAYQPVIKDIPAKETPVDADAVVATDSADSNAPKRTTWTNVKAFLKTYFDGIYAVTQDTAVWEAGTETDETIVSPAKIRAAVFAAGGGAPDAVLEDRKSSGTDGGSFTSGGWRTRTLNTEVYDNGSVISLAGNAFTPAVDGVVEWSAPASEVGNHKTRLYNVTDGATAGIGSSERASSTASVSTISTGIAEVVGGKTYRLEHQCDNTSNANGFGRAAGFGVSEVYSQVKFWRTA